MASAAPKTLTQLLLASSQGDQNVLDEVMPVVYDELRRLARSYMRRERPAHRLQTTVLVDEAYLRPSRPGRQLGKPQSLLRNRRQNNAPNFARPREEPRQGEAGSSQGHRRFTPRLPTWSW
jgi:hypothetical protein